MLRRIFAAYNLLDYAKIGVLLPFDFAVLNWRSVNRPPHSRWRKYAL